MNTVIEFYNVSKKYTKNEVLKELSFAIYENEYVGLIGNNGCGKTTTINCICNLIEYDKGSISVFGNLVTPDYVSYKNQLGIVLSNHYLVDDFNIIQYWSFISRFQRVQKDAIKNRINDLISLLDLHNDKNKQIKILSAGSKMKVALGAALIHNPKILIFDEPLNSLDIQTSDKLIKLLKSLKNAKTLFITSHNLDHLIEICDRFLIMNNGKISIDIRKKPNCSLEELKNEIKHKLVNSDINMNNIDWLK